MRPTNELGRWGLTGYYLFLEHKLLSAKSNTSRHSNKQFFFPYLAHSYFLVTQCKHINVQTLTHSHSVLFSSQCCANTAQWQSKKKKKEKWRTALSVIVLYLVILPDSS